MPLIKEDFFDLSLFELLTNIALYFDHLEYMQIKHIANYLEWNIEFASEKWPKTFPNFNFVVMKIRKKSSVIFYTRTSCRRRKLHCKARMF